MKCLSVIKKVYLSLTRIQNGPNPNQRLRFSDTNTLAPPVQRLPVRSNIDWDKLEKNIQEMNLKILRDDLQSDPHQFLINMIMLSVQFFKNFDR